MTTDLPFSVSLPVLVFLSCKSRPSFSSPPRHFPPLPLQVKDLEVTMGRDAAPVKSDDPLMKLMRPLLAGTQLEEEELRLAYSATEVRRGGRAGRKRGRGGSKRGRGGKKEGEGWEEEGEGGVHTLLGSSSISHWDTRGARAPWPFPSRSR